MTTDKDNRAWALSALDMAYTPKLRGDAHDKAIAAILRYFDDATLRGINQDRARKALYNELLDIMPVIVPLRGVLRGVLRGLSVTATV